MNIVEELSKKIKLTETEKEILEYMVENLDALLKLSSRKNVYLTNDHCSFC